MNFVLGQAADKNRSQETKGIDTDESTTRLELLYEVAKKADSYSEVLKLIEAILCVTQRILKASASSLFLIDKEKGELCFQADTGKAPNKLRQIKLDLNSGIAGWVARNGMPVVVNDVSLDKHFNKDIDEVSGFSARSIIAVPLRRGEKVIGVIEVINKADGSAFNEQDLMVLTGFASTEALILLVSMSATAISNIRLCQSIQDEYQNTIETLVTVADAKDPFANGHSQRVKEYALLAANSLSFAPKDLRIIEFGALLHDIGKIGINDNILCKPGPLTDKEWDIMRKHSLIGADIVGEIPFLEKARVIVLNHHERYDGKGYPEGLKGEDIPIGARLVAVADAFDTMITDHSYRAALSVGEAIDELIKGSGTQFCPVAVEAFISGFEKHQGTRVKKEAGRVNKGDPEIKAREKAEREAREKAEQEAREKAEQEAREKAEQEAREKAEREAREKAEPEAKEQIEGEAKQETVGGTGSGGAGDAVTWMHKGKALSLLGRNEEAFEAYLKATELDPTNAVAWRKKGIALGGLGRDEEALESFVKAIELDPKDEVAWSNKITALVRLGRDDEARKAKETEKQLKKEAWRAAKERARKETEEARKARDSEKLMKKENGRLAKEQAKKEAKKKAEQEAREKAEKEARKKAEKEAKAKAEIEAKNKAEKEAGEKAEQEARGKAEKEAGEKAEQEARGKAEKEAREKAEKEAEEQTKKEAKARAELEARERAGKEAGEKAEKDLKETTGNETQGEIVEVHKASDSENAASWMSRGRALSLMGKNEEALGAFTRATELDPKDAVAWRKKGTALGRLGRDEDALEAFVKAIELDPKDVAAWTNKVTALVKLGRNEEASKAEETEKQLKREAGRIAKEQAKKEAKEERKVEDKGKLLKKENGRAAKEQAVAEKASKPGNTEKQFAREVERAVKEQEKREADEARKAKDTGGNGLDISSIKFEGDVQLTIKSPADFAQINQFKKCLRTINGLKIVLDGWSEDEGSVIVVSAQKPLVLGTILGQMPMVSQVEKKNGGVVVILQAPATAD